MYSVRKDEKFVLKLYIALLGIFFLWAFWVRLYYRMPVYAYVYVVNEKVGIATALTYLFLGLLWLSINSRKDFYRLFAEFFDNKSVVVLFVFSLAFGIAILVIPTFVSCDLYTYTKYGQLFKNHGWDIYKYPLKYFHEKSQLDNFITGLGWETSFLYGPLSAYYFRLLASGNSLMFTYFLSRVLAVVMLYIIADFDVKKLLWYLLNPIIFVNYIFDGHVDIIMMAFVILAYKKKDKPLVSVSCMWVALLLKSSAILFIIPLLVYRVVDNFKTAKLGIVLLNTSLVLLYTFWSYYYVLRTYNTHTDNSLVVLILHLRSKYSSNYSFLPTFVNITRYLLFVAIVIGILLKVVLSMWQKQYRFKNYCLMTNSQIFTDILLLQYLCFVFIANQVHPWYLCDGYIFATEQIKHEHYTAVLYYLVALGFTSLLMLALPGILTTYVYLILSGGIMFIYLVKYFSTKSFFRLDKLKIDCMVQD